MARETYKNSKHIAELIESATVAALQHLAQIDKFAILGAIDTSLPEPQAREALREHILAADLEQVVIADQEAVRLLQLVCFRTEEMLEYARKVLEFSQHAEFGGFDRLADAMTRLIWLRVKDPSLFDQIETIYLAHHFHGHKKFRGFTIRNGDRRDFQWTPESESNLYEGVAEVLELEDREKQDCELIHFEMDEGEGDTRRRVHYLVVYHPGKMQLLRQVKDRRRDLMVFKPALKAVLVYDPDLNKVHVLADRQGNAQRLAECFVASSFDKTLSSQPVAAINYELGMFKEPVNFDDASATGAVILDAWVSSLTVTLGHTRHTVKVMMVNNDSVWDVSETQFGDRNPLSSCRAVIEVKLSFSIRFDGEQDARALDIAVNRWGSCNLLNLPDSRLRQCGEDILTSLGVMQRVEPAKIGASLALFQAEMQLFDLAGNEVDGYLLAALDLEAGDLLAKGLLRLKNTRRSYITIPVEDEEGRQGLHKLKVDSNSTETCAFDEVTGKRYDLTESDWRQYEIRKDYLRERLEDLLRPQLTDVGQTVEKDEPYLLGNYLLDNQYIPVVLVSRLWNSRHANKLDTRLRQLNRGLLIVLSTTADHPRHYLGPGIVFPINELVQEVDGKVSIDLALARGRIRHYQGVARGSKTLALRKESASSAILSGQWSQPWELTKKEWVDVVGVLVEGWKSGQRKFRKGQLESRSGIAFRSMKELFRDAPEWQMYIRGADGNTKPRVWELNIVTSDYHAGNDDIESR